VDYIPNDLADVAIRNERDFETHEDLLKGFHVTGQQKALYFGLLPLDWATRLREEFNNHTLSYVVTYGDDVDATPIGWITWTGKTFVPPMNFSASSLSAQEMLRGLWPEAKTSPHA